MAVRLFCRDIPYQNVFCGLSVGLVSLFLFFLSLCGCLVFFSFFPLTAVLSGSSGGDRRGLDQ
jgi:hypothetical protein